MDVGVSEGDRDTVGVNVVGDIVGISVLTQRGRRLCSDRPCPPPPLQLSPCQVLIPLSQQ